MFAHIALFNYGFESFAFSDILKKNDIVQNIEIENGKKNTKNLDLIAKDTLSGYLDKNIDWDSLEPNIKLNENLMAPILSGSVLGSVSYTIDGEEYSTDLVASHDVEKKFDVRILVLIVGTLLLLLGIAVLRKQLKRRFKKRKHK